MPWKLEVKAADGLWKEYCQFCRKLAGHKSKDCPKKYGRAINGLKIHNEDDFRKQQEKMGRCPVCQENHAFRSKTGYDWLSPRLSMCEKFTELSTEEKAKKIESVGGCVPHFSTRGTSVIRNKGLVGSIMATTPVQSCITKCYMGQR
jgi:hypothetical protein